uniref:Uncharacterized protein n=1 Tax=Octopus bimaculoides TaxID=37653 RepID=A0A0L8IE97_OCTBM
MQTNERNLMLASMHQVMPLWNSFSQCMYMCVYIFLLFLSFSYIFSRRIIFCVKFYFSETEQENR